MKKRVIRPMLGGLSPSKVGVKIRSLWNSRKRLKDHYKKVKPMLPHLVKRHHKIIEDLEPREKEYLDFYLANVNQGQQVEGATFYWDCAKRLDRINSRRHRFTISAKKKLEPYIGKSRSLLKTIKNKFINNFLSQG